jgi:hypothetical protein
LVIIIAPETSFCKEIYTKQITQFQPFKCYKQRNKPTYFPQTGDKPNAKRVGMKKWKQKRKTDKKKRKEKLK